jgi:hypothetical protein
MSINDLSELKERGADNQQSQMAIEDFELFKLYQQQQRSRGSVQAKDQPKYSTNQIDFSRQSMRHTSDHQQQGNLQILEINPQ